MIQETSEASWKRKAIVCAIWNANFSPENPFEKIWRRSFANFETKMLKGFRLKKNLESELRERDREINVLKEELNISEKDFAFEKAQKSAVEANATAAIDDLRGKCEESQKENDELKANLNEREIDIASLTRLLEDGKKNESRLEAELETTLGRIGVTQREV